LGEKVAIYVRNYVLEQANQEALMEQSLGVKNEAKRNHQEQQEQMLYSALVLLFRILKIIRL